MRYPEPLEPVAQRLWELGARSDGYTEDLWDDAIVQLHAEKAIPAPLLLTRSANIDKAIYKVLMRSIISG